MKKLILASVLLAFIPLRHFGQTPYRQYADDGITLNFFEIGNPDFRLYLLYNLEIDDQFSLLAEETYGLFIVNPTEENADGNFFDTFESFYTSTYADFRLIEKVDLYELVPQWKESVPSLFFASITMDIALNRATTENNHCVDSDPFCTSDLIQFQAANTSQTADQLEGVDFDDGCIGSSYNPSWYHMRINTPGQFIIHMEGRDPDTNAERDIDFCMWGPFTDPTSPCVAQLTEDKIIDCSYSAYYSEDIFLGYLDGEHYHGQSGQTSHGTVNYHVPEVGEYYILMITNFSREPCVITFTKTEGSGPGTTDCGILPGIATNGGPYCVGETIQLSVNAQSGATYSWTGPDNFTSTLQNPTRPNCTFEMGGTYTCITSVNGQTTTGNTDVIVFAEPVANFTATTVCEGEATQFTSTASTEPSGQEITGYYWDFGDGGTSEEQNVSHTYASAGEYQVTHAVVTGNGRCSDEITQTVLVVAIPEVTVTASPSSVIYGGIATLTAVVNTPGNFTFHWEPANMVTNPNSQTTQTVMIEETQVFTVTVTNTLGDCATTMQVTVNMAGSNLTATATADAYEICEGGSTTLHANPVAGTGTYTYSWSPAGTLSGTSIQNPVATPPVGSTTYTCVVGDGLTTQEVNVTIVVHPNEASDTYAEICEGGTYNFYGQSINTAGNYNHTLQTQYGCDSLVTLHLTVNPVMETDFYVNDDEVCDSYPWAGEEFTTSGEYTRTFTTQQGCDSIVTLHLQLEYTPDPIEIYPTDPDNVYPHWVVTATEFQINAYEFGIYEQGHPYTCHWDSIAWSFENPNIEWFLEPDTTSIPVGKKCKIYILNFVEDTVWVRTTIYNRCAPQGISQRYWFICSFYDIDEFGTSTGTETAKLNVAPNPNNGQMTLYFENLTGKIDLKVYDMTGNLIDQIETEGSEMQYNMKGRTQGIYYFLATGKEGTVAKKVIVR